MEVVMNNKPNNAGSWVTGVRAQLSANPPSGWVVLEGIAGRGVQLCPKDCVYLTKNKSGLDLKLVGTHKIVFEFFRLDGTGDLKISARVAGIKGQALYHEFFGIARGFGCPLPRKTRQTSSQSVAAWPPQGSRHSCAVNDHAGMAKWVRRFLSAPPADFTLFVAASRNLLVS